MGLGSKENKIFRKFIILALWSLPIIQFSSAATPPSNPVEFVASLEEVLSKNLDGISLEQKSDQELAAELADLKKRHSGNNRKKDLIAEILQVSSSTDSEDQKSFLSIKNERKHFKHISIPKKPNDALWVQLQHLTDYEIYKNLKKIKSKEFIRWLSDKALTDSTWCKSPAGIHLWLAQRAEEDFPDTEAVKMSLTHYEKAAACASDPSTREKARFRFAMLSIWQNKCDKAVPQLQTLISEQSKSFGARALYWSHECQKKEDEKQAAIASIKLVDESPFSFHTLLVAKQRGIQGDKILKSESPAVRLRTGDLTLDHEVRNVELFQRLGMKSKSGPLLSKIVKATKGQSPDFRLYLAVLKQRQEDFQQCFAIVSEVLSTRQSYFSTSLLKLLFPEPFRQIVDLHSEAIDPLLVTALMRQESSFNPNAKSRVGARGLMQIMPATARTMARIRKEQLNNPDTNVKLGIRYFKMLLARFDNRAELALAAYNAGSINVEGWMRRFPGAPMRLFVDLIPFSETRDYVAVIMRNYYWYRWLNQNNSSRTPASNARGVVSVLDSKDDIKI